MNKQFSIFDWIKSIIDSKQEWESFNVDQHKIFNNYMILRFLSMNPMYIEIVNYIQSLNIKDSKKLYKLLCSLIPQSKKTYSPYIKSSNKQPNPDLLKHISEFFQCSTREASDYIQLMDKKGIQEILEARGVDDKEVKKLLK